MRDWYPEVGLSEVLLAIAMRDMAVAYSLPVRPEIVLDNGNASVTITHGRGSGVPGSERI